MLCGIPQGFILGHISCLLYIYDVTNIWNKIKFILFADDNNVLYAGKSITQVNNVLNNELKQMIQWFKVNKLSLNINKANYMCFHNKPYLNDCKLKIDRLKVSTVQVTKFLAVL